MNEEIYLIILRANLSLMSKGMRHSRISYTKMLSLASAITGKKYKRGGFDAAISDINQLLEKQP